MLLRLFLDIIFLIDCIALTIVVLMQEGKQQACRYCRSGRDILGQE